MLLTQQGTKPQPPPPPITSGMPIQLSHQGQHQSAELAQRVVKVRITLHEKFWQNLENVISGKNYESTL